MVVAQLRATLSQRFSWPSLGNVAAGIFFPPSVSLITLLDIIILFWLKKWEQNQINFALVLCRIDFHRLLELYFENLFLSFLIEFWKKYFFEIFGGWLRPIIIITHR